MADTTRFALNLALCEHVCVHSLVFVSMGGEGGWGGEEGVRGFLYFLWFEYRIRKLALAL